MAVKIHVFVHVIVDNLQKFSGYQNSRRNMHPMSTIVNSLSILILGIIAQCQTCWGAMALARHNQQNGKMCREFGWHGVESKQLCQGFFLRVKVLKFDVKDKKNQNNDNNNSNKKRKRRKKNQNTVLGPPSNYLATLWDFMAIKAEFHCQ